jgi:hypothetical protein
MELTDRHIEAIREAARSVKYGSVTINISESSDKLELNVQNRIRIDKDVQKSGTKPNGKA